MKRYFFKLSSLLLILFIFILAIHYYHLNDYLSVEGFNNYHNQLLAIETKYPHQFVIGYILIYIVLITFCIPGTILLDLLAGFIFGSILGSILIIFSYGFGSILNFILIRYFLKDVFINKFSKFKSIIHGNGRYGLLLNLLGLRIIAIIPFWILNIASAVLNVKLSTFIISTLVGIVPSSIIYAVIGSGVHDLFANNQQLTMGFILNPKIWLPIFLMAVILFIPNVANLYKHTRVRK